MTTPRSQQTDGQTNRQTLTHTEIIRLTYCIGTMLFRIRCYFCGRAVRIELFTARVFNPVSYRVLEYWTVSTEARSNY